MKWVGWLLVSSCVLNVPRGTVPIEQARALPRVVVLLDEQAPDLHLEATVRAGSAYDPIGGEGLAALTARALTEGGAGERSAAALRDALALAGTELELVVGKELMTVRLRCERAQAALCVELFGDVLTAPRFEPERVERLREQAMQRLGGGAPQDEARLSAEALDLAVFHGHPYGHPVDGRRGVLALLDAAAVRGFYREHYLRQATVIGVGGALDADQVEGLVRRMSALGDGLLPERSQLAPVRSSGRSLWVVETASETVSFRLGHALNLPRSHEDYPAMYLAFTALGAAEPRIGALVRSLGEERGLNDGSYAYIEPSQERSDAPLPEQGVARSVGLMHLWIRPTSTEHAPFALKLALEELELLVREGIAPERFAETQTYLQGAIARLADDPGRRLSYAVEAEAMGWPDPLDSLADQVASLSVEQVNDALRVHVRPDDLRIVAVGGGAREAAEALRGGGATPMRDDAAELPEARRARDARVAARVVELMEVTYFSFEQLFR